MKHYIGTKTVQAEPMTKGAAFNAGLLRTSGAIPDNEKEVPGYKVLYDNGYESWSPANVFEAAYKAADTPLDRLKIEMSDLQDKGEKLAKFIFNKNDGKDYQALPREMQALLIAQHHLMGMYHGLLDIRYINMEGRFDRPVKGLFFEQALCMLREGYALRRSTWKDNKFIVRQIPAHISADVIPTMQSLPVDAKRILLENTGYIDYTCQCLIIDADLGRADSWCPSISDVFAQDWELMPESDD